MTPAAATAAPEGRLEALDLMRGLALGGMLLVHFQYYTTGGGAPDAAVGAIANSLSSAYTLFAFLFGASFGLQLLRAQASGRPYMAAMVRRMLGLAALGLVSEALTGYHVLNLYVLSGFALLALARCSERALVALIAAALLAGPAVTLTEGLYNRATRGVAAAEEAAVAERMAHRRLLEERERVKAEGGYGDLVLVMGRQRLEAYLSWRTYVPGEMLALALLGLWAVRRGVPQGLPERRRWVPWAMAGSVALGAAGVAFWARWSSVDLGFKPLTFAVGRAIGGVLNDRWLGFAVALGMVWLTSARAAWRRALSPVASAGRMAITHYVFHIFALEWLLGGYWFQVEMRPLVGVLGAAALFAAQCAFSHLWLRRFRYGPLEWAWRWASQGSPPPLRTQVG